MKCNKCGAQIRGSSLCGGCGSPWRNKENAYGSHRNRNRGSSCDSCAVVAVLLLGGKKYKPANRKRCNRRSGNRKWVSSS